MANKIKQDVQTEYSEQANLVCTYVFTLGVITSIHFSYHLFSFQLTEDLKKVFQNIAEGAERYEKLPEQKGNEEKHRENKRINEQEKERNRNEPMRPAIPQKQVLSLKKIMTFICVRRSHVSDPMLQPDKLDSLAKLQVN